VGGWPAFSGGHSCREARILEHENLLVLWDGHKKRGRVNVRSSEQTTDNEYLALGTEYEIDIPFSEPIHVPVEVHAECRPITHFNSVYERLELLRHVERSEEMWLGKYSEQDRHGDEVNED